MARQKKAEEPGPSAPAWMSTYGDMVTLVLCFFVLLYAFSTLDAKKFEALSTSLQSAFNIQSGGESSSATPLIAGGLLRENTGDAARPTDSDQAYTANRVLAMVQSTLNDELAQKEISVSMNERGVVISMSEQVLFDEGSAKIHPEARRLLYKIGEILKRVPNDVSVEGHTDSGIPVNSVYGDNWGLSSARASRVASYLNGTLSIPAARLRAVGFGASAPIVPNDSEEHMKLNRRVDIVILSIHKVR